MLKKLCLFKIIILTLRHNSTIIIIKHDAKIEDPIEMNKSIRSS